MEIEDHELTSRMEVSSTILQSRAPTNESPAPVVSTVFIWKGSTAPLKSCSFKTMGPIKVGFGFTRNKCQCNYKTKKNSGSPTLQKKYNMFWQTNFNFIFT